LGIDIIEPVDPFKIYKPAVLAWTGAVAVELLFLASVFVYRPWCHLVCPFGLAGWLVEKISIFKIKVYYDTCIACEACARACPSSVMDAILKQDRTIPDCFSCANCVDVCPTDSVSLAAEKREKVPEGKFG
jgi:polyferredoxin